MDGDSSLQFPLPKRRGGNRRNTLLPEDIAELPHAQVEASI
jgi:hypothetical protein